MTRYQELVAAAAERMDRVRRPGRYAAPARAVVATVEQRDRDFTNVLRNHLAGPTVDTVAVLASYATTAERADRIRATRMEGQVPS